MQNKRDDPVEVFLTKIFRGIALFLKTAFYGAKRLKKPILLVVFLLIIASSILAFNNQEIIFALNMPTYAHWLIYSAFLALPLLYLFLLGSNQAQTAKAFYKVFQDVGFIGKDKKYPMFLYSKEEDKKEIFAFRSNIPLETWRKSVPQLETAMDCNILRIDAGKSKKEVILTTVATDFVLPENILWRDSYISDKDGELVIGENALDQIKFDLNRVPHVLAAGETGSGKSVILRAMLWQMAKKKSVLFMLDFKGGVEFGLRYEKYGEVITDRKQAVRLLELLVKENERRLLTFRQKEVKNLKEYNNLTGESLSRIGVFCDEIAEMLDRKGSSKEEKEIMEQLDGYLSTLARLSRATGINLFLGVQRPDANVLTGQIKNNVPVRICGRFADKAASEIVLGNTDAVKLPDVKGRFLFKAGADTVEFQAYYFDDDTMLGEIDREGVSAMLPELTARIKRRQEESEQESGFADRELKRERAEAAAIALNLNYDGSIPHS
ncbi:MAG TPA: hypothetical protein DEQ02_02410 [Ruminococcaceae bacterium]|nr:hypothetical protein [Oscillospiraceae bacterium]